jgi:hypothetical protein
MQFWNDVVLRYYSLQLYMTQILWYYFTTVKPQYCLKLKSVWFHWKNKVYVERREENWGSEWSFENSKNTTVLVKPWYLKLCFDCTNQTPFVFQYHSIIKYHSIVSKLQKYYTSKQVLKCWQTESCYLKKKIGALQHDKANPSIWTNC